MTDPFNLASSPREVRHTMGRRREEVCCVLTSSREDTSEKPKSVYLGVSYFDVVAMSQMKFFFFFQF